MFYGIANIRQLAGMGLRPEHGGEIARVPPMIRAVTIGRPPAAPPRTPGRGHRLLAADLPIRHPDQMHGRTGQAQGGRDGRFACRTIGHEIDGLHTAHQRPAVLQTIARSMCAAEFRIRGLDMYVGLAAGAPA